MRLTCLAQDLIINETHNFNLHLEGSSDFKAAGG